MSDSQERHSIADERTPPTLDREDGKAEDHRSDLSDALEPCTDSPYLGLSSGTETLDFNQLFSPDITNSGSYDLRGRIWTTTFGKLLQALPLMAFLIDHSCKIVAANRSCAKLSSDYQKAIGTPFAGLFPDSAESRAAEKAVRAVFSTRKQQTSQALMRLAEAKISGRMTFRSIRVGTDRLVLVLVEDLTTEREKLLLQQKLNAELTREIQGRRKAEEDLATSERRYRQVVEAANDVIYTTDAQGRFAYVNPVALRKSGFSREELVGRSFLALIHPDHRDEVKSWYLSQYSTRTPQTYYEFPFVAKGGAAVWVGQNVQLLMKDENVVGFQAIARDISERKRAEEQLNASVKEKEVLMREIHHRVKNNFQVISALLSLQADHAEERNAVEVLTSANARIMAMALVHEKLYQSSNLAQIRIDEYVGDLVNYLIGFGQATAVGIATEIRIEELYFGPDTVIPIGLIITELLTNAMKHAFPDGREGAIQVRLQSTDTDHFELLVSDNGVGLPAGIQPGKSNSLGLGLVAAFARKLRGDIHLDTSKGTEFSMRFKRAEVQDRSGDHVAPSDSRS